MQLSKRRAEFVTASLRRTGTTCEQGPPPQVIWLTCGNTSNPALRRLLEISWPTVATMLARGEALVEITGAVDDGTKSS